MTLSTIQTKQISAKEFIINLLTFNYKAVKTIINRELKVSRNHSLLDIGCGTGIHSLFFPTKKYVGIDIDEKLIAYAKKHYDTEFRIMDATKLAFPKHRFDKIIIVGVIHHLSDKDSFSVCKGMKNVLKKNSEILVIEAIPPILQFNFLGAFLRSRDEGKYIRKLNEYKKIFSKYFSVKKAYEVKGGLFDYGVFLLHN